MPVAFPCRQWWALSDARARIHRHAVVPELVMNTVSAAAGAALGDQSWRRCSRCRQRCWSK